MGLKCPVTAYNHHKYGAAKRKIVWEFTFESWWEIWKPYFHLRGGGKNCLCMGRNNDTGPYSPSNVYLTTKLGNMLDYHKNPSTIEKRKLKKESKECAFARASSNWKWREQATLSNIAYISNNTSKSTCNFKDEELS